MKIVNRGFISVKAKQPYIDWVNQFEDEFVMDIDSEPSIYLVEEDFFELEPVLKANFKKIFKNELEMITEEASDFPPITLDNFLHWFSVEMGASVFDCQTDSLIAE